MDEWMVVSLGLGHNCVRLSAGQVISMIWLTNENFRFSQSVYDFNVNRKWDQGAISVSE